MSETQPIADQPNTDRPILRPLPGEPTPQPILFPDPSAEQVDHSTQAQSEHQEPTPSDQSGVLPENVRKPFSFHLKKKRARNYETKSVSMELTEAERKFLDTIAPEFRRAMLTSMKARKRALAYYYKNREKVSRQRKEHAERAKTYNEEWYKANGDYVRARARLYHACFPHRKKAVRLALRSGMNVRDLAATLVTPEHDRKCEETYHILMCELRKSFGRDPITGVIVDKHRKPPSSTPSPSTEKESHQGDRQ